MKKKRNKKMPKPRHKVIVMYLVHLACIKYVCCGLGRNKDVGMGL